MRHLKLYEGFLKRNVDKLRKLKAESAINVICHQYNIRNYTINNAGSWDQSIDVNDDVVINNLNVIPLNFNRVTGRFACYGCDFKSLELAPKWVGGSFQIENCVDISSLEGCPEYVGGNFLIRGCDIWNFDHFPKTIVGSVRLNGNPINNIFDLFKDESKINMFQDYDIIREDRVVVIDRLKSFLEDISKEWYGDKFLESTLKGYKCI